MSSVRTHCRNLPNNFTLLIPTLPLNHLNPQSCLTIPKIIASKPFSIIHEFTWLPKPSHDFLLSWHINYLDIKHCILHLCLSRMLKPFSFVCINSFWMHKCSFFITKGLFCLFETWNGHWERPGKSLNGDFCVRILNF